jgi:drug/metabolite transporter (DMT)-like permease
MGALLALASAACYGIADVTGGLLSRRANFALVALAGQAGGLGLTLPVSLLLPTASPGAQDLGWGAISGVGTGVGMVFLFRGLSRGAMSVVVPVSAVGGMALPVLIGVALLGDRPSVLSWLGIVAAVPALWLVSRNGPRHGSPVGAAASVDGLIAGAGIALQYVALAQATPAAGIWPVTVGRLTALVTVLPAALATLAALRPGRTRSRSRPTQPTQPGLSLPYAAGAAATGVIAALALVLYLLATREQLVVIAVVLASLYPVIPVLLALTVLRERPTRLQAAGLLGAATAIGLLTAG